MAETETAIVLYTSGTTGAPKGVVLSHRALRAGIEGLADAWGWTGDDVVAHGLPLFHTHGLVLGVLGSLHLGSRVVHTGRPTPQAYAATPAPVYFGVPTVCSCRAALRCPCPSSSGCASSRATRSWSATA